MGDELFHPELRSYLDRLVPARPEEMRAMEAYAAESKFPIIGPASGQFCYLIARLIGAKRVFELGSGFGYSTAWFAKAVQEHGGGEVYHVVWERELSRKARTHLDALGFRDIIKYHVGEATEALRQTAGPFDLVFNDIDKEGYLASLPVVQKKLRSGGVLIVDNMLWSGRIFDDEDDSKGTHGIRELTARLTGGSDWITTLVPIRDGLLVALKK